MKTPPTKEQRDTNGFLQGGAGDSEVKGRGQVLQVCASCQTVNPIVVDSLPYVCYRCCSLNYPNANP